MTRNLKFAIIYLLGISIAVACFFYGGVIGFILLGAISALLFEGFKPAYLIGSDELADQELVNEEVAISSRQKREMVWTGAIAYLNRDADRELGDDDDDHDPEFEWQMYLTALARLASLDRIDADFAGKSLSFFHVNEVNMHQRKRLLDMFVLALYEERLSDFFDDRPKKEVSIEP